MPKLLNKFIFIAMLLFANEALSCANGCGIFNVGTRALIPNNAGGVAFLQYDYMNQNQNWHRDKKYNALDDHHSQDADHHADNPTKIRTQTTTFGAQYMINREWGAALRLPFVSRFIKTEHGEHEEKIAKSTRVHSLGDVQINGIYSGFFSNMSTGITFGLKLPTGKSSAKEIDGYDMQIGTGSTDLLLGAYRVANISAINLFAQINWQHAFLTRHDYRQGDEFSGALGTFYDFGAIGKLQKTNLILQIIASKRKRDSLQNGDRQNSGYVNSYFAPAIEIDFNKFKIYADMGFPIYQYVNGEQLTSKRIYKLIIGYTF